MERTLESTESTDRAVAVLLVGADNEQAYRDAVLKPGTRCLDLLRDLGLNGYGIRRPDDSGAFFAATDDIYAAVVEAGTSKLEAVPGMQVALETGPSGPVPTLRRVRQTVSTGPTPPFVVGPRPAVASHRPQPIVVSRPTAATIERQPIPLWQTKGWRQATESTWQGHYSVAGRTWGGHIERTGPTTYRPWIVIPPEEEAGVAGVVRRHPHFRCFMPGGAHRYFLHFSRDPNSVDGALMAMENFLHEAFVAAGRQS